MTTPCARQFHSSNCQVLSICSRIVLLLLSTFCFSVTSKMNSQAKTIKPKLTEKTGHDSSRSGPLAVFAVSTDTTAQEALASNYPDLFNNVFTNDIIWGKLGGYLNLDDLKDCRLTCQLFNVKIIDLKSFKDRARLNIPLSKFPASDLRKTHVKWRHLAVNVDLNLNKDDTNAENSQDLPDDTLCELSQLLSSIISLKLYRTNYCSFKISPGIPETFSKILPMMSNIQGISIDLKIFEKVPLTWFARAAATLMSKVKELRLECKDHNLSVPGEVMYMSMSLPSDAVHLEVFCLDSFVWRWNSDLVGLDQVVHRFGRLFPILRQNQNHLRSLQIKDFQLWTSLPAERFGTLPKFPQLKVLKLKIRTEEGVGFFSEAHLIQFLNNQPDSLEEIELDFLGSIPSAVFQILKDRAMRLNLKVLRVSTDMREPAPSDMKNWKFLKETNLEEFSLQFQLCTVHLSNEQLKDFFGALPKNAKRLKISGVKPRRGQDTVNLELSKCFNPEVLTHLNLHSCPALMNDSFVQEIWKTLKNLRLLDLSYCGYDCTDWGFTGVAVGLEPQGVAISFLKGLKFLTLQGCMKLTDRTLIDGMVFPELQFLDLKDNDQFTKSGYLAVIRQNPSLQTFVTQHDEETHEDLLRHINFPQIRSVKINSRLTREFCPDYDCDRCKSDNSDDKV